jgi:hypothetical protein
MVLPFMGQTVLFARVMATIFNDFVTLRNDDAHLRASTEKAEQMNWTIGFEEVQNRLDSHPSSLTARNGREYRNFRYRIPKNLLNTTWSAILHAVYAGENIRKYEEWEKQEVKNLQLGYDEQEDAQKVQVARLHSVWMPVDSRLTPENSSAGSSVGTRTPPLQRSPKKQLQNQKPPPGSDLFDDSAFPPLRKP